MIADKIDNTGLYTGLSLRLAKGLAGTGMTAEAIRTE